MLSVARLEGSGIDESTLSSREVAILTFLKLIFNVFLPIEKGKLSKYLKFLCNNNWFYINILIRKLPISDKSSKFISVYEKRSHLFGQKKTPFSTIFYLQNKTTSLLAHLKV